MARKYTTATSQISPVTPYTPREWLNTGETYASRAEPFTIAQDAGGRYRIELDHGIDVSKPVTVVANGVQLSPVGYGAAPAAEQCAIQTRDNAPAIIEFHASRNLQTGTCTYTPIATVFTSGRMAALEQQASQSHVQNNDTGTNSPEFTIATEGIEAGASSILRLATIDYDGYTPGCIELRATTDNGLSFILNDGADSMCPVSFGLISGNGGSISNLNANYIAGGNIGYSYMPSGAGTWNCGSLTIAQSATNVNSDWIGISRTGNVSLSGNITNLIGWRQFATNVTLNGHAVTNGIGWQVDAPQAGTNRYTMYIEGPTGGTLNYALLCGGGVNVNTISSANALYITRTGYARTLACSILDNSQITITGSHNLNFVVSSTQRAYMDTNGVALNGRVSVGTTTTPPTSGAALLVTGDGQTTANYTDAGSHLATLKVFDATSGGGHGGAVTFGAQVAGSMFAGIKGLLTSGANQTAGDLVISTRNANSDNALTERMRFAGTGGSITIAAPSTAINSTSIGFYGTTPVTRPAIGGYYCLDGDIEGLTFGTTYSASEIGNIAELMALLRNDFKALRTAVAATGLISLPA